MYDEDNLDIFTRGIEMINEEALSLVNIKDFSKMFSYLKERGGKELLKFLPPLAVFNKMQILQEINRLSLAKDERKTIIDGFTFWGDYETPLVLMKDNYEIEKEEFIKGFCFLGQNKYKQALQEFAKISELNPELAWKYIYICALVLNDELFLQNSLINLQKFYHPDEYLVFYDLAIFNEEPTNSSGRYLFYCWQMMLCFIQLNKMDKFNLAYKLAKAIDNEKTMWAALLFCWSTGRDFTPYLSFLEGNENWKYFDIIKADYLMEQGESLKAWHTFKKVQNYFPDDIFVKTGIAFAALLEGEKIGKEALSFFSLSELIQERVQFIQREISFISDNYKFLRMLKKKERKILKYLITV